VMIEGKHLNLDTSRETVLWLILYCDIVQVTKR